LDKCFEVYELHQHWSHDYGAAVICPPRRNSRQPWPKGLRRFVAGARQIVETVNEKLHHAFRLSRERPHALAGAQARVAAKAALHNFCIGSARLARRVGRRGRAGEEAPPAAVVFTRDEARDVLAHLRGDRWLMGSLLYGSGLRLMECVRLRVKDLDFVRLQSACSYSSWLPARSSRFVLATVRGLCPVHRLNARENAAGSENPTR